MRPALKNRKPPQGTKLFRSIPSRAREVIHFNAGKNYAGGKARELPPCAYRTTMAGASWYMLADRDPRRKISNQVDSFILIHFASRKKISQAKIFTTRCKKNIFLKTDFLKILYLRREFSKIPFFRKNFSASSSKKFAAENF